jgi:hypothetical protein
VLRLCEILRLTVNELGALYLIDQTTMNKWLRADRIPPYASLHFALLENWYAQTRAAESGPIIPIHLLT